MTIDGDGNNHTRLSRLKQCLYLYKLFFLFFIQYTRDFLVLAYGTKLRVCKNNSILLQLKNKINNNTLETSNIKSYKKLFS